MVPCETPSLELASRPDETVFLKGLIDGMRCGVLTFDTSGRLRQINDLGRRILQMRDDQVSGLPLNEALFAHPQLAALLLGVFEMNSLPNRAELALGPPGSGKTLGFTISLVRGDHGDVRGAAMFFKDLTQIEHHEEQERLKDRLVALGHMASSMAHEIRNPLAAIEVTCKLLKRRIDGDRACVDLLEKITSEVRRLNQCVNSSLEYVRPVSVNLVESELSPLLQEAITIAEGRRGRPQIQVRRALADIPPFLMDRDLLRQVFVNLVLNALEAVGDEGTVDVTSEIVDAPLEARIPYQPSAPNAADPWADVEHLVLVRVVDSGPGIEEGDRDRIFNPFFTTKPNGSGVGLAMAKKIVGGHRGLIVVANAPGQGAEFQIRLPMARRAAEV